MVMTAQISTVNYHLLLACNMACDHCFAADLYPRTPRLADSAKLVGMLAQRFRKINFAGGEPLLYRGLDALIRRAKGEGMFTSVVTNGTLLGREWLEGVSGYLDMVTISVDSADPGTHKRIGRAVDGKPVSAERYLELGRLVRECGMRLKVNTVVGLHNHAEDMTGLIEGMRPERWKIMQVLTILGQNDGNAAAFEITGAQFEEFVERNRAVRGVRVVPENNRDMTGSYVMVDPLGRFFDNTKGRHTYSRPVLDAGVDVALGDIRVYPDRFEARGGRYE